MKKVNLFEVKAQFSKYIDLVESGETVIVCKRNIPVAEIRPVAQKSKKLPELGWAKGKYKIPADFVELPDAAQWEGDAADPLRKYDPARAKSAKSAKGAKKRK